jgi:hypothetical protein
MTSYGHANVFLLRPVARLRTAMVSTAERFSFAQPLAPSRGHREERSDEDLCPRGDGSSSMGAAFSN